MSRKLETDQTTAPRGSADRSGVADDTAAREGRDAASMPGLGTSTDLAKRLGTRKDPPSASPEVGRPAATGAGSGDPYATALAGYDSERAGELELQQRQLELRARLDDLPRESRRTPEQAEEAAAIQTELDRVEVQLGEAAGRKNAHRQVIRDTEVERGQAMADPDEELPASWRNLAHVGDLGVGARIAGPLEAARQEILGLTGWDLAGDIPEHNGIRRLDQSGTGGGQIFCSWHKTGRAVDLDQGVHFLRFRDGRQYRLHRPSADDSTGVTAASLTERQGEPTHTRGRWTRRPDMRFVDVTEILLKHGFTRISAHSDGTPEWWHYELRGGVTWYQGLLEVHDVEYVHECLRRSVAAGHVSNSGLSDAGVPVSEL